MKNTIKKIAGICKKVFGYAIMISLFAGGLTFFGYLAALIIGGDTAVLICDFLYNKVLKVIIYFTNIFIIFGLLTMYLSGEKALMPTKNHKHKYKKSSEEKA